jgi:hypothetical protein
VDEQKTDDSPAGRVVEALVARANELFVRIMKLDEEARDALYHGRGLPDLIFHIIEGLVSRWYRIESELIRQVEMLRPECGPVEVEERLRNYLRDAEGFLHLDDTEERGEALAIHRDKALKEHRAGKTQPAC